MLLLAADPILAARESGRYDVQGTVVRAYIAYLACFTATHYTLTPILATTILFSKHRSLPIPTMNATSLLCTTRYAKQRPIDSSAG